MLGESAEPAATEPHLDRIHFRRDPNVKLFQVRKCVVLEQCVILLGGLGTRLGDLTKALPKPLLPVGESPFVEVLISEAWRRGFRKYLLLAGHRAEAVSDYLYANDVRNRFGATIELSIEPIPLGTGGALVHALDRLDDEFLLLNGDTWFDFNWMDFMARSRAEGRSGGVALRSVVSPDRYETVEVDGVRVSTIRPRGSSSEQAFINGGGAAWKVSTNFLHSRRICCLV